MKETNGYLLDTNHVRHKVGRWQVYPLSEMRLLGLWIWCLSYQVRELTFKIQASVFRTP